MTQPSLRLAEYPDVLTATEVARVLRCDRHTVYDLLNATPPKIGHRRAGRRRIIPKRAVEKYLSESEEAS
jgi:excisionase family DNA binding protein